MISRRSQFKRAGSSTFYFLLSIIIIAFLSWTFISCTSYSFKNRTLELLGSKNLLDTKTKVAEIVSRYYTPFNRSAQLQDVYNSIWTPVFNPNDPESSWGTRIHKTIFPLTGQNVEIVPPQAKGYLMDNTCNPTYYKEIDLCESFTFIVNLKVIKGEHYYASVYCFVSSDFDGTVVSFAPAGKPIVDKVITGNVYAFYDLNKKGTWQKLVLDFDCNDGEVPIFLFFNKNGISDFSTLIGHVIFAYPTYEKTKRADSILSFTDPLEKHNKLTKIVDIQRITCRNPLHDIICESPGEAIKDSIKYPENKATNKNCEIKYLYKNDSKIISAGQLSFTRPVFINLNSISQDKDPVRNWIAKIVSEDTTYYPFKSDLNADSFSDNFGVDRLSRWKFAWEIFSKEYNWTQKIIGGAFNFLNWYGYYFLNDKTKIDYPHNPLLSILLYSGILGLIIYLFFLYKVFILYLKYIKENTLLFIFFLITFFFTFFSGGSPLDPPVMGFFVMLSFFINYIEKRLTPDKEESL